MGNSEQDGKTFSETLAQFFKPDKMKILISATLLMLLILPISGTLPYPLHEMAYLLFMAVFYSYILAIGHAGSFIMVVTGGLKSLEADSLWWFWPFFFGGLLLAYTYTLSCLATFGWGKFSARIGINSARAKQQRLAELPATKK